VTDDAEIRRMRAALGASSDAILTRGSNAERLLEQELRFAGALAESLGEPQRLSALWRELRNSSLAWAADLPASEHSLELLRARLALDQTL
jgi:hypothetical protein